MTSAPFDYIIPVLAAAQAAAHPRYAMVSAVLRAHLRMKRPALIAVGKAAPAMREGFLDVHKGTYDTIMVVPPGIEAPSSAIIADHPIPTPRCQAAAERVARFTTNIASGARGHDGFIVLLSGGASALLSWPVPEISLDTYALATKELLARGLDIQTLNSIRKHCERIKGGRLGLMMSPLPCITFILSDVIGDELSTVGSGPTLPDPTTFEDAYKPFEGGHQLSDASNTLARYIDEGRKGKHPETPGPGDPRFVDLKSILVGSNSLAVDAAVAELRRRGWHSVESILNVTGDAATVGRMLASRVLASNAPHAIVVGGETTVDVGSHTGRGGRNQELALAAAIEIDGCPGITIATRATDGVDGPTDAAGALVTGNTCCQARNMGLDAAAALARHDSYTFFDTLDKAGFPHLIRTGPTGTNVNDVAIALRH